MKKQTAIILISLVSVNNVSAQKIAAEKVPAAVTSAFTKTYPATAVKWEKEKAGYEASFRHGGKSMSASYEQNGMLKETETDIKISGLPEGAVSYVKAGYPGNKIKEAARIVKANGTIVYEAEVSGKDLLFDEKGNFLEAVKD